MTTNLHVTGMSCNNCVGHVEKALRAVEGVHGVTVVLEPGSAVVEHDAATTVESLIEAVTEEGYEAVKG